MQQFVLFVLTALALGAEVRAVTEAGTMDELKGLVQTSLLYAPLFFSRPMSRGNNTVPEPVSPCPLSELHEQSDSSPDVNTLTEEANRQSSPTSRKQAPMPIAYHEQDIDKATVHYCRDQLMRVPYSIMTPTGYQPGQTQTSNTTCPLIAARPFLDLMGELRLLVKAARDAPNEV